MRKFYFALMFFLINAYVFGQSLSPTLVASLGDQTNSASCKTSWSVGDLLIQY